MNRTTSLYLDLVRFFAAVAVLVTHLAYPRFSGGLLLPWRTFGNDAVMIFFVLSGYVIAYTAATRDRELGAFVLNRFARLYSVALPAVILTVAFDHLGQLLDPKMYAGFWYQDSQPIVRVLTALTFTNELWFSSWRLFTNGPYWSLGYEFWYYLLFAAGWFFRGRQRVIALVLGCAFVGPKILLLLPIWLLGVWVYRLNSRNDVGESIGWLLFVGSLVAYFAFRFYGMRDALLDWSYLQFGEHFVRGELRWSDEFLSAYVIGPLVAANFVGFNAISSRFTRLLNGCAAVIRDWAGYTFSIYLFHYPILQLLGASGRFDPHSPGSIALLFVLTILACRLIGNFTEKRKDLARALLQSSVDRMRRMAGAAIAH
jgi:peptidoglycan/LPS O-acetylase OafA/YrhL